MKLTLIQTMAQADENKYDEIEQFDTTGNGATIQGTKVTLPNYGSAYGTELVKSGQRQWTVKSTFASKPCQWIGISANFEATQASNFGSKGYCLFWCNACGIQGTR